VLIIDDSLSSGNTMKAAEDLVNSVPDAECVGTFSLFEVMGFNGSKKLN